MNNYCRNCGERLTNTEKCEKCGTKVLNIRISEVNKELERKYLMIFAIILLISGLFSCLGLGIISIFSPLIILIFVIYAKEKLKVSKLFNVIFWIILLPIILFLLCIILLVASCTYAF